MAQRELIVPEALAGSRLDKVVAEMLGLSRAATATLLSADAMVDGRPAKPSDRVSTGQTILCNEPGEAQALEPEPVDFGVLFEDEAVVVVDKPPALVVHPGAARASGTLAAGLIHRYPELVGVGAEGRWGLVHRLDKDTSGALIVARTAEAFESLTGQLKERSVSRTYTALVEGEMAAPTGTVDAPIDRDPRRPTLKTVGHGGREARTHYQVDDYLGGADLSLLMVQLETGRTHQVRVHMSSIGHPVVGDWAYGALRRDLDPPRVFLHASSVEFHHPSSGEVVKVESPLPEDLVRFLDRFH